MIKSRITMVVVSVAALFGMVACNESAPAVTYQAMNEVSGNINGVEYSIYECEMAKYQKDMLEEKGFYVDYLEEDDSPAMVFISPGEKSFPKSEMNVQNIEVDKNKNVTITVFEAKNEDKAYPIVEVELYPAPASIKVVDVDGNELAER